MKPYIIFVNVVFSILNVLLPINIGQQVKDDITSNSISLDFVYESVYMSINDEHKIQGLNMYHEGLEYLISLNDSASVNDSSLIMVVRAPVKYPTDYCTPDSVVKSEDKTISYGKLNGKLWRRDKIKGFRLYYYNVSNANKHKYDDILNSVEIKENDRQ